MKQYYQLGGITNIDVDKKHWRVSDDTVMHIATGLLHFPCNSIAEALVQEYRSMDNLFEILAKKYILSGKDFEGRAPGMKKIGSN